MKTNQFLIDFYNHYDEDRRLAFKHGSVEFLTTMHYIAAALAEFKRLLPDTFRNGPIGLAPTGLLFLNPEHNNFTKQVIRHRFMIRQLYRSFGVLIVSQPVLKRFDSTWRRMKPHMILLTRKMNQVSMKHKRSHPPGNFLCNLRRTC